MKRQIILLQPHSFIDVITNSSTELFVGDTDKTTEFIREVIQSFLNTLNKLDECHYNIDEILTIGKIDETNVEDYVNDLLDYNSVPYQYGLETFDKPDPWYNGTNHMSWEEKRKIEDDYVDCWKERNLDKFKEQLIGKVIIIGTGDNSIPYELFDIIEYRLLSHGTRVHLG
jgi:hypothetical protein